MTDIKRYDLYFGDERLPRKDGHYVLYTDHLAALEAVKAAVKPLEWEEPSVSTNQCWTAKSPFGTYSVVNEDGWYAAREPEGFWEWNGDRVIDTRHTAFAACQSDYQVRILSALAPSPALEAKTEGE